MSRPYSMRVLAACKHSGLGRTKLYQLIAQGKITALKCGSRTLILTDSLETYIASLPRA